MTLKLSTRILASALLAATFAGCKHVPSGVIRPDKMSELLADIYQGESMVEYNSNIYFTDSTKKVVKQSIFAANGVTQTDFDSSLVWYGHNIGEFVKVCDGAIAILETRLEEIPPDAVASSIRVAGDSAQVWALPTYYRITDKAPSHYISFLLDSDDEWQPGDTYDLNMKITPGASPVRTTLAVDYDNGLTQYINASSATTGWLKTHLQIDSTMTPTRVYGFINFDPAAGEIIYLDSVSLLRSRLNRNTYYRRSNLTSIRPAGSSR
ncbi:MAG: DUF4296 domain-containing protein [Muribaculaceae bacterium]|nr:DUF4296 domain-containing protein [Muribaculaceae bacterium]